MADPNAPITLAEYGSYNCPFCRAADEIIADLRDRFGDRLRYVFRHRPISGDAVASRAAELAQYAYETTDEYWPAHAARMQRGPTLHAEDLMRRRFGAGQERSGDVDDPGALTVELTPEDAALGKLPFMDDTRTPPTHPVQVKRTNSPCCEWG